MFLFCYMRTAPTLSDQKLKRFRRRLSIKDPALVSSLNAQLQERQCCSCKAPCTKPLMGNICQKEMMHSSIGNCTLRNAHKVQQFTITFTGMWLFASCSAPEDFHTQDCAWWPWMQALHRRRSLQHQWLAWPCVSCLRTCTSHCYPLCRGARPLAHALLPELLPVRPWVQIQGSCDADKHVKRWQSK